MEFCDAVSLILLGFFLAELVVVAALGAVRSRAVVGPGFDVDHSVFIVLGTPALANALILGGRGPLVARWYVAAAIGTIFALFARSTAGRRLRSTLRA